MSITLTAPARAALNQTLKSPNLIVKIDGIDTLYSASLVERKVRIGDGHKVGRVPGIGTFKVGGNAAVFDQSAVLMTAGTSTSIKQSLDPAKGQGSNVSSLTLALIDDGEITDIITPDADFDIMQRKVLVYLGFQGTSWPEDCNVIFRGFVTDVTADAGKVIFQLNGTDEKQRSTIFAQAQVTITSSVSASSTSFTIDKIDNVLQPILGPTLLSDPSVRFYFKADDEIIEWSSITSANGVYTVNVKNRGAFNTPVATHTPTTKIDTFYQLTGNPIDLALKLMLSGNNDGTKALPSTTLDVTSINVGGADTRANSLYFAGLFNDDSLGVVVGDFVKIFGSSNPLVNDVYASVVDVVQLSTGLFVTINHPLVTETITSATAAFTSQYNTLPDGCLMQMDDVDVAQFLKIQSLYMSGYTLDFYLKDSIDSAKEFIEQEIYLPLAAYSIPRKAKSSVGYFAGPIPGAEIVTFDENSIKSPDKTTVKRSTNSNFYNEIVYAFDEDPVEDEFDSGFIAISETSKNRIKNSPSRQLLIESKGLRSLQGGQLIAQTQSARRLTRYQFGAESFSFSSLLDTGYTVEVGDIVVFDGTNLMLPDIKTGRKGIAPRLLEIQNKEIQLKSGDLKFTAIDTNYDGQGRHALISPSSQIVNVMSNTEFTIGALRVSDNQASDVAEYKKWQRLPNASVIIRAADYSVQGIGVIASADSNTITLKSPLSFTPRAGNIMEFSSYSTASQTKLQHLVYGYMNSSSQFADGSNAFTMI